MGIQLALWWFPDVFINGNRFAPVCGNFRHIACAPIVLPEWPYSEPVALVAFVVRIQWEIGVFLMFGGRLVLFREGYVPTFIRAT